MYKVIARTCTKCGLIKLLDNFINKKSGKFGKESRCKHCIRLYKHTTKFTRDELINEIRRAYVELGRIPRQNDMQCNKGYIGIDNFYSMFGTLNNALIAAGLEPTKLYGYTIEMVIEAFNKFIIEFDRVPTCKDFDNNPKYPSSTTVASVCGSWNNGLEYAGLQINKSWHRNSENDMCSICGTTTTSDWYLHTDKTIICSKCRNTRYYYKGTLNPNSYTAIGIITEHVVYKVLEDCIKCNTDNNFNAEYDLISEKYGTINVKSAALRHQTRNRINWGFVKKPVAKIPDNYICLGFNETRMEIQHVWIIPGNSKLVTKCGIFVALRKLERAAQYEVDPEPYNKTYQNLDIYTLPEFRNLPRNTIDITVPSTKPQEVS